MEILKIGNNLHYAVDNYTFKVNIAEIGNLKLSDMPTHTRIYINGIKKTDGVTFILEAFAQNNEDGIYHQIGFTVDLIDRSKKNGARRLEVVREYFKKLPRTWKRFDIPQFDGLNNNWGTSYWLKSNFIREDKPIIDQFKTALTIIAKFKTSRVRVFLCHSSTDKAIVESFAIRLKLKGSLVWFDKWSIKIGDSIVEKINDGLTQMTHLLVFLSKTSIKKPWVRKEFSSGLMLKLSENSIKVIPILLDKVELPTIIKDIKYADCTKRDIDSIEKIIEELFET